MANGFTNNAKELDIAERRAQVADLTLDGYTQREIARQLGVALGTVNGDIKAVMEDYRTQAQEDILASKKKELDRLDKVIRRAVEGWHRSCETEVVVQKTEGERGDVKEKKTVATRRAQSGDASFLSQIQSAVEKRAKILGLYAPVKHSETNPDGTEKPPADPTNRVSDVLAGILLATPTVVAGNGSNGKRVDTPRANGKTNGVPKP